MIIVCDTSPLNYLVLIGHEYLLPSLFQRVLVPSAVFDELSHPRSPAAVKSWLSALPDWIEIRSPSVVNVGARLGRGEAAAIGIARELRAGAILIDERRAASIACELGIFVIGTLGVLELASQRGIIDLAAAVRKLRETNFRASEQLLVELVARDARRRQDRG